MKNMSRRDILRTVPAAALAAAAPGGFAVTPRQRVFVASNTPDGIRAFDWNPDTGELTSAGVAASVDNVDWITEFSYGSGEKFLFAAAEVDTFNNKPTGEVASLSLHDGKLKTISARNSAAKGTCHCAIDHTGQTLLSADYGGGSAASFKVTKGQLSEAIWTQHYTQHGPNKDRQEAAHAHFASFSPDNRYAFINDLGGDRIHIYRLNAAAAELTPHGEWHSEPGAGPRTLHFHPNGVIAYCMKEMASAVSILRWHKDEGKFTTISNFDLHPDPSKAPNTGCDTVITRDGRFVYFANRGDDFIYACHCDPKTGALTPIGKTPTGGKTPRNFTLDPTERWVLVANQNSSKIAVFARNPKTGAVAPEGKTYDCATPMCILFT